MKTQFKSSTVELALKSAFFLLPQSSAMRGNDLYNSLLSEIIEALKFFALFAFGVAILLSFCAKYRYFDNFVTSIFTKFSCATQQITITFDDKRIVL